MFSDVRQIPGPWQSRIVLSALSQLEIALGASGGERAVFPIESSRFRGDSGNVRIREGFRMPARRERVDPV